MHANRWQRALSLLAWALVGLSAAYWGLRLGESGTEGPAPAPEVARPAGVDAAAVVAALGGAAPENAAPAASSRRLELLGVIAEGQRGVAVIAVDGQPGRPYAVGTRVDHRLVLKAVGRRHAELAEAGSTAVAQRLEMPPLPVEAPPAGLTLARR